MPFRAMGALNGTLPVPTGMIQAYVRDVKKYPYLRYAQLVPAPEIVFSWAKVDSDEFIRLVDLNSNVWAYGDYRPAGKDNIMRVEMVESRTTRYDFPYTIDDATQRIWKTQGFDPKGMFDQAKASQAGLHRASRVVNVLANANFGANEISLNALLGTTGAGFDKSSGQQYLTTNGTSVVNPGFQVIRRSFMAMKRLIHLATNGMVSGNELIAVLPPTVAQAMAQSGEIVDFIKGGPFAKELLDTNLEDWSLPKRYGGFELVVEDTVRVFVNPKADGTIASVGAEKNFILDNDTVYFVTRPGALDAPFGGKNMSTIQVFHFNGESRVEAFTEPKHELVEGHVVMEDKVVHGAPLTGFKLTDVLT